METNGVCVFFASLSLYHLIKRIIFTSSQAIHFNWIEFHTQTHTNTAYTLYTANGSCILDSRTKWECLLTFPFWTLHLPDYGSCCCNMKLQANVPLPLSSVPNIRTRDIEIVRWPSETNALRFVVIVVFIFFPPPPPFEKLKIMAHAEFCRTEK